MSQELLVPMVGAVMGADSEMVGLHFLDVYSSRLSRLLPNFFIYFATYSIIFPIVFGVFNFKRLDLLVKSLVVFLFIELANELYAFYLAYHTGYNGIEYGVYFILETCYFAVYFYLILRNKWIKPIIVLFIPSFIIMGVFILSMAAPKTVWFTSITVGESTSIVILSIIYYYELITAEKYIELGKDPDFWIITGILTFAVLSFFSFGFWNYLHTYHVGEISHLDLYIIAISNIFMYAFFTFAFLCPMKSRSRQLN